MAYELEMTRLGYMADEVARRVGQFTEQRDAIRQQIQEANDEVITAAQENAANRQVQLVRDHNRQIFDSLKQQAGGVFDVLLTKSQSVWSAIGNSFKTAMLTAIKEVVTSQVARMLMGMFGARSGAGATAPGGAAGGGGWASVLGGFGAVPLGGSGVFVPGGGTSGTPPFLGGGSGGFGGSSGGGMFSPAGWSGMLGNLKDFAGIGGSVQTGAGTATTWGAASMGQKLSSIGKSNAALMGGSLLVMDGLRRGGKLGLAETTAGGALIGFTFGGPLGAAIGAISGAVAGTIRLFVKGAREKAREKIKAVYGVDISDNGLLKQIVDTAKSAFGGNLDLAIRSPEIRELIELYAMSTGQKATGLPGVPRASTLVQSGGSMYESPGFSNGSPLPSSGGLDGIGEGRASLAQPMAISLNIDGKAVGAAVIQNGRVVVEGALSAMRGNSGRRQMTALQMSPGTIVS